LVRTLRVVAIGSVSWCDIACLEVGQFSVVLILCQVLVELIKLVLNIWWTLSLFIRVNLAYQLARFFFSSNAVLIHVIRLIACDFAILFVSAFSLVMRLVSMRQQWIGLIRLFSFKIRPVPCRTLGLVILAILFRFFIRNR